MAVLIFQTGKDAQLYESDLRRILDILEENGFGRDLLKVKTVGIDFEIALKQALAAVELDAVYDVMHLRRRWWKKFAELGGQKLHNRLKECKVDHWFRTFQEVFAVPVIRPDIVPRSINTIYSRMKQIIRTAKNQGIIFKELYYQVSKFQQNFFLEYLSKTYTSTEGAKFNVEQ